MAKEYIEKRGEAYWVVGTRVSLESIVYGFLRGESPGTITRSFPTLTLEEVYGAIAFYLANQDAIDVLLESGRDEFKALREHSRAKNPELYRKLDEARHSSHAPRR